MVSNKGRLTRSASTGRRRFRPSGGFSPSDSARNRARRQPRCVSSVVPLRRRSWRTATSVLRDEALPICCRSRESVPRWRSRRPRRGHIVPCRATGPRGWSRCASGRCDLGTLSRSLNSRRAMSAIPDQLGGLGWLVPPPWEAPFEPSIAVILDDAYGLVAHRWNFHAKNMSAELVRRAEIDNRSLSVIVPRLLD